MYREHRIITGQTAKRIDDCAIRTLGIPSLSLMERAAEALYRTAAGMLFPPACGMCGRDGEAKDPPESAAVQKRVLAVCGTGNNGADVLLCAAMLSERCGVFCTAVICGRQEAGTEEFRLQKERFEKAGGTVCAYEAGAGLPQAELILDGLFGIGLSRPVKGLYAELCSEVNQLRERSGAAVLSADIPSGIDASTGQNLCSPRKPVQADRTVTFGFPKTGHYLDFGYGNCGLLSVADIGYPEEVFHACGEEKEVFLHPESLFYGKRPELLFRNPKANKGSYRKLLIIAGSEGMAGAAYLCGSAAYRSGVGMVKFFGPESNRVILQTLLPEAMYESYEPEAPFEEETGKKLSEALGFADLIVLGPGLSQRPYVKKLVEAVLRQLGEKQQLIIDADALNVIARERELLLLLDARMTLTPHIGELARLLERTIPQIKGNLPQAASELAAGFGGTVAAKDCVTLVCGNGERYLFPDGSAALSKAGSGDVLSGIIAGMHAVLPEESSAKQAAAAVYLHSRAADRAAEKRGEHGLLAGELAAELGLLMEELGNGICCRERE